MRSMRKLKGLRRDQRGLSTVEYTVLLVLILAGAISLWKKLGGDLQSRLDRSVTEFEKVQVTTTTSGGSSGSSGSGPTP
jgi:Flp pilus assembly pilin Flp